MAKRVAANKTTSRAEPKPIQKRGIERTVPASKPAISGRRRARIGDIFEVRLRKDRLAYIQYVFDDRRPPPGFSGNGPLVRVLSGTFRQRPSDVVLNNLARSDGEQFLVHFPCTVYAWRGSVDTSSGGIDYVLSASVPERLQRLPRFKKFNQSETGRRVWYAIETEAAGGGRPQSRITQLGDKLPRAMIDDPLPWLVNLPALVEKIESGWTHAAVVRQVDVKD